MTRRSEKYRLSDCWGAREGRRLRHRSRRMQRELTNRAQSSVRADLRRCYTVMGDRTPVKMCDTNKLRDKDQRRAKNRDRAGSQPVSFVEAIRHQDLAEQIMRTLPHHIEPAA
jgi:hypothetical protein